MEKKNNNSDNEKVLNENELDEVSGGSEGIDKDKFSKIATMLYGALPRKVPAIVHKNVTEEEVKKKIDDLKK